MSPGLIPVPRTWQISVEVEFKTGGPIRLTEETLAVDLGSLFASDGLTALGDELGAALDGRETADAIGLRLGVEEVPS